MIPCAHMTFGINKCATMVIKAPDSRVVGDPWLSKPFYILIGVAYFFLFY